MAEAPTKVSVRNLAALWGGAGKATTTTPRMTAAETKRQPTAKWKRPPATPMKIGAPSWQILREAKAGETEVTWMDLSDAECAEIDAGWAAGKTVVPLSLGTVVAFVRSPVSGVLTPEMRSLSNKRPMRRVGAAPFRANQSLACGLGLENESKVWPQRQCSTAPTTEVTLMDLPDTALVEIFRNLTRKCTCSCHRGQGCADRTVRDLCTLELVCKRFHDVTADMGLSLPDTAAMLIVAGESRDGIARRTGKSSWKEELLHSDAKTAQREEALKDEVYSVAFGSLHCDWTRHNAELEIIRRWGAIDEAMKARYTM